MPVLAQPLRHATWLLPMAVLLAVGFVVFTNSGPDDTHITYWPALELLRHGKIDNYNGDALEQSSSLAHVLLTAAAARLLGLSVSTAGHLLAVAAGALCVPLVYWLACRIAPRSKSAAPWFVATTAPFLHWTFGGLEAPIFGLSMLGAAILSALYLERPSGPRWGLAWAAMLFMVATRPEGPLVLLCGLLAMVVLAGLRAKRRREPVLAGTFPELRLLGAGALASGLMVLAHLAIGGHPFPNPVRAKAHGLDVGAGMTYLATSIQWRWAWAVVAFGLGGLVVLRRAFRISRARGAAEQIVTLLSFAYLAFIATVGGDWMWGGRLLAHVAPLFGLVVVVGAARCVPRRFRGVPLAVVLVLGNYLPLKAIAEGSRTGRPFWEVPKMEALVAERYPRSTYAWPELASGVSLRDIPVTEELKDILTRIAPLVESGPVVVASRQAGFTIFHALVGEHPPVRFIDLHNLATDDYLACGGEFLRRETHGALLPFRLLVNPPPALREACPIVRPHVFFDVPRNAEPVDAERAGYTVVFRQRGKRGGGGNWADGHSAIFIAVDADLAARAGLERKLLDPLDYDRVTTASLAHRY